MLGVESESDAVIDILLERARRHLRMDVAFVTAVDDGVQRFIRMAGAGCSFGWVPSTEIPASDGYCQYVLSGELPNIVADANAHLVASKLAATRDSRIGAYLGVPLQLASGRIFGALCLASHDPSDRFGYGDVEFMRFVGHLIADELSRHEQDAVWRELRRDDLVQFLADGGMQTLGQPIRVLTSNVIVGVEALTAFPGISGGPLEVFIAAEEAGLLEALEIGAVAAAFDATPALPTDTFLSVNASPLTVAAPRFAETIGPTIAPRLVVELTEHAGFDAVPGLLDAVAGLREKGVRFAIDDIGSGYATLSVILALKPELLKIDIDIVRGVHIDTGRQALVRSIANFAQESGTQVIAEGIETQAQRDALIELGVRLGQGYFLGRPVPFADITD